MELCRIPQLNSGPLRHMGNRFDLFGLPSHVVLISKLFSRGLNNTNIS